MSQRGCDISATEHCGGVEICRFKSRQDSRMSVSTFSIKTSFVWRGCMCSGQGALLIWQSKPTVISNDDKLYTFEVHITGVRNLLP